MTERAERAGKFEGEFDEILAAAQQGAPWAFERIFTVLSPIVHGYLRMQGAHEPEDLTSEVFVAVLRNLDTFRGDEGGFRSWVFTIAHRRLIDERRRAVRLRVLQPLEDEFDVPAPDDVAQIAIDALGHERVRALCER